MATVFGDAFTSDPGVLATLLMRELTAAEFQASVVLLEQAAARIVQAAPSVPSRVAAGTLSAAVVQDVQTSMVLRVLRNPEGLLQEQGDTYSYRRDSAVSTGALYLSSGELATLTPSGGRPSVGTIRLGHVL